MAKKRRPGPRPTPPAARQRPGPAPAAGGRPGGRPLPASGGGWYTPGASGLRLRVERASAPALVVLNGLPRLAVSLIPLVLLVLGVVVPVPWALIPLAVVAVFVAWLAFISWPALAGGRRTFQAGMLLLVVLIAVLRVATA